MTPPLPRSAWTAVAVCVLLALATLVVYLPARTHAFVSYDDPSYVTENPHVLAGLSWAGVKWALTTNHAGYWHPVTWLSHMLDVQLFGRGAAAPHLENVLLHVANTLLAFVLLRTLTGALWRSAFVAGVFALHPLHVESVAWVAERKDVLSAFFFLLTLLAYAHYVPARVAVRRGGSRSACGRAAGWYLAALGGFALAIMSKPMAVTLPCVLLLLDYWPLQRIELPRSGWLEWLRRSAAPLLVEKIPFLLLTAGSSVVTSIHQRQVGTLVSIAHLGFAARIANALVSYARYLGKTLWPVNLAVFYPHPVSWSPLAVMGAALLLLALFVFAFWSARERPYVIVGWLWFVGMLVPTIGFVQVGLQAMADRYAYLPMLGLLIALTWAAHAWLARWRVPGTALSIAATALLVASGAAASAQLAHWRNDETLYTHALAVTDRNAIIENNFAGVLIQQGRLREALPHLQRALAITPDEPKANNNLADILSAQNRLDDAIAHYRRAIQARPDFAAAHAGLGRALLQHGNAADAAAALERALQLEPRQAEAEYRLGDARLQLGQPDQAVVHFRRALTLRPDSIEAHNDIGVALIQLGRADEALEHFRRTVEIDPKFAEGHFNVAKLLRQQGQLGEAIAQYRAALQCEPGNLGTLANLAWVLATAPDVRWRNGVEATALARQALKQASDADAFLLRTFAAAEAECGDFSAAQDAARRGVELATRQGDAALAAALGRDLAAYAQRTPLRDDVSR